MCGLKSGHRGTANTKESDEQAGINQDCCCGHFHGCSGPILMLQLFGVRCQVSAPSWRFLRDLIKKETNPLGGLKVKRWKSQIPEH